MNYIVKIGFDHEDTRYNIGDSVDKKDFKPKTWKELVKFGVVELVDDIDTEFEEVKEEE